MQPPIINANPNTGQRFDVNRSWNDIRPALQAGARAAYMAGKNQNPQLIVVLLPVSSVLIRFVAIRCMVKLTRRTRTCPGTPRSSGQRLKT
jgi:hypothetical protein